MASRIPRSTAETIHQRLSHLYPEASVPRVAERLITKLETFDACRHRRSPLSEATAVLIAYGDHVIEPGVAPLRTLADVAEATIGGRISDIHVLPFFPYSSDDGFSVMDYERVDSALGSWTDIRWLGERFGLMVDLVINHVSAQSRWFQGFLRGEAEYADYFITVDEDSDLSGVVRPRALPLLTPVETSGGTKHVWTTFSADQVDLNYENPDVLLRMIDVLLLYVQQGATLIRLDAVAFLWKEIGGTSIHCAETHCVVKLLRTILDAVAPDVLLITETNVPHEENISYFGDGTDEAQLVYQFPLPPLVVDAFLVASAESLCSWAESLRPPPGEATFFNFLASHDGIGLRPLEGLVPPSRVQAMVDRTIQHGGRVSYKHDSNGQQSAYELNISFFDALNDPAGEEPLDLQVRKFLTAQAIMLSLAGVPGIYFHSLFGSRSWREGMEERGNRAINREKLDRRSLMAELEDPASLRSKVFAGYSRLLSIRSSHDAFHPNAAQRVIRAGEGVFGVLRGGGATRPVLCLHNVTPCEATFRITPDDMGLARMTGLHDILSGAPYVIDEDDSATIPLPAYATVWLAEGDA